MVFKREEERRGRRRKKTKQIGIWTVHRRQLLEIVWNAPFHNATSSCCCCKTRSSHRQETLDSRLPGEEVSTRQLKGNFLVSPVL